MISLLAIPPGDMSAAALLLVVGPGLTGLQVKAAILLGFFWSFFGGRCTALFFPFAVQEERISHT